MSKRSTLKLFNTALFSAGLAAAVLILVQTLGMNERPADAATEHETQEQHAAAAEAPADDCCATDSATAATPAVAAAPQTPEPCCAEHAVAAAPAVPVEAGDACCAEHAPPAAAEAEAHPSKTAAGHGHGDWCGEHDVAEAECAICQPQRTALLQPGEGLKLRLAAAGSVERAGAVLGNPLAAPSGRDEVHRGRISFDERRIAHLGTRSSGVLETVDAMLGTRVKKGETLARLTSPATVEAETALQLARSEERLAREVLARETMLREKGATSLQDLREAEAAHQQAQLRTRLSSEQLSVLGVDDSGAVVLRSPLDGVVVEQHAVVGENVEAGETLFTIADTSSMWLEISIPAPAVNRLQEGDLVEARVEGLEGVLLQGTVAWLDARVDPQSRTILARAEVANPGDVLKDGMVAEVRLGRDASPAALMVPTEAVQEYDGRPYVFVRLDPDLYEVRQVSLGTRSGGRVAVTGGLAPEEQIVLARSFTVKSEFLKARLGAGCTDH